MFCYLKHFALNDTETGRALLANYWADEQTMREIYLRPFEIAIEEARMTLNYISDDSGTMSSQVMPPPPPSCPPRTAWAPSWASATRRC